MSGETWDIEFDSDNLGNWPFHCHISHYTLTILRHVCRCAVPVRWRKQE
ncbi:multicopper oxidase domain-containing protein [Thermosinus carboxydivorans]